MSRSAADATRFTATSPHATSRIPPRAPFPSTNPSLSSTFPSGRDERLPPSAGPPGETPKQKVERLRAAARVLRERKSYSPVERAIEVGRKWADRFHRATTLTLIAATGLASITMVYSIFSIGMHNRTQKRAFVERELNRLHLAKIAYAEGTATEEQIHLVDMERAGEAMASEREERDRIKKENSYWNQGKRWLFGGLSMEDKAALQSQRTETQIGNADVPGRVSVMEAVSEKIEETRREGERKAEQAVGFTGGPLDAMAENVVDAVKTKAIDQPGWMSWVRGK